MSPRRASKRGNPPPHSMRRRLEALLGERRRTIVALGICSTLSGLTEAGILAVIAQIATAAVRGGSNVSVKLGPVHLSTTIGTLFAIAFGLTLIRIALQAPLAILPARIAADVQARYLIVMTPRIAALVEAIHEPGARLDLPGLFRRFDSELLG